MKQLMSKIKSVAVAALTMGLALGAWADEPVEYLEPVYKTIGGVTSPTNGIDHWETKSVSTYTVVTKDITSWNTGWYVVKSDVLIDAECCVCSGDVKLILCDGATLSVVNPDEGAISTDEDGSFTIYGQEKGTGALNAIADDWNSQGAGIGGCDREIGANITINGGVITATGAKGGAGIGGGIGGAGSNITINGGTVTATGSGAGIGGGNGGAGSNITINGGTVIATGAAGAAAIGSGQSGGAASNIFVADNVVIKAGDTENPTTVIEHASITTDIAGDLAGKRYATAEEKAGPCEDCLTFTSKGAFSVKLARGDEDDPWFEIDPPTVNLEYSTDKINWSPYVQGTAYDAAQSGDDYVLYLRGTNNRAFGKRDEEWGDAYLTFKISGDAVACSGNIETLLDYTVVAAGGHPQMDEFAFFYLFENCTSLTVAPTLSATNLAAYCCYYMFSGCTALTNAPALPATTLAESCYNSMFDGCRSLTTAPALPAKNLAESCYFFMFNGCQSLVVNETAPGKMWSIPSEAATAEGWNSYMFTGTGGTFTGGPTPGTTYYIRSAVAVIEPGAVEGAKVTEVSTNGFAVATAAPYVVEPNAAVTVVYTADEGYEFAGGAATWTTNFTASAATVTVTIPEGEWPQPTVTPDYLTFTAEEDGSSVTFKWASADWVSNSTDGVTWNAYTAGATIPLAKVGDKVMFKGKGVKTNTAPSKHFAMTGKIAASGDVGTLTDGKGGKDVVLTEACYVAMFYNCTSLTTAPELPGTNLVVNCYAMMFQDCTSLTEAPDLPAMNLATYCYGCMFKGCTSLVVNETAPGKAWSIPAGAQTANQWNQNMFSGTGGTFTGKPEVGTTYYIRSAVAVIEPGAVEGAKVTEVSTNGFAVATAAPYVVEPNAAVTVVYTADEGYEFAGGAATWTTNVTASAATITVTIPEGEKPTKKGPCEDCLTFTGKDAFSVKLARGDEDDPWFEIDPPTVNLEYSTDKINWSPYVQGTAYDAALSGDDYVLYLRGTNNTAFAKYDEDWGDVANSIFTISGGAVACSGNIETLLDYTVVAAGKHPPMGTYAFDHLFSYCTALTAAPELPAETLAERCYNYMFYGCTALTNTPALPATTLAEYCYNSMFYGCTALTAAPELPATTLMKGCYNCMFVDCTSLTTAPALPATTLLNYCYNCMFSGCTALVANETAPGKKWSIPSEAAESAKTAKRWNSNMFRETGGEFTGEPTPGTTYYVGAKKEIVGDATLYRYEDKVGVSVSGELTKAIADTLKDKAITNLVVGTGVTSIGDSAFASWRTLRDVEIGADCVEVGALAFGKCHNVTNIACAATEEITIGNNAFVGCNSLEALSFGAMPDWGETPFLFYSGIYMKDGIPEVYAMPTVTITGFKQVLKGSNDLKTWENVDTTTPEGKAKYHFFKIVLEAKY